MQADWPLNLLHVVVTVFALFPPWVWHRQANVHNRMLDSKAIVVRAVHLLLPAFVNALGDNKQVCISALLFVFLHVARDAVVTVLCYAAACLENDSSSRGWLACPSVGDSCSSIASNGRVGASVVEPKVLGSGAEQPRPSTFENSIPARVWSGVGTCMHVMGVSQHSAICNQCHHHTRVSRRPLL